MSARDTCITKLNANIIIIINRNSSSIYILFGICTQDDDRSITAEIITTSSFYDDTSVMQSNNEKLSIKEDVCGKSSHKSSTEATDVVVVAVKYMWSLLLYYSCMLFPFHILRVQPTDDRIYIYSYF